MATIGGQRCKFSKIGNFDKFVRLGYTLNQTLNKR